MEGLKSVIKSVAVTVTGRTREDWRKLLEKNEKILRKINDTPAEVRKTRGTFSLMNFLSIIGIVQYFNRLHPLSLPYGL